MTNSSSMNRTMGLASECGSLRSISAGYGYSCDFGRNRGSAACNQSVPSEEIIHE